MKSDLSFLCRMSGLALCKRVCDFSVYKYTVVEAHYPKEPLRGLILFLQTAKKQRSSCIQKIVKLFFRWPEVVFLTLTRH